MRVRYILAIYVTAVLTIAALDTAARCLSQRPSMVFAFYLGIITNFITMYFAKRVDSADWRSEP